MDPLDEFDDSYRYCVNPIGHFDPDGQGDWRADLIGGAANAGANIVAQKVATGNIDWKEATVAFGVGFLQTEVIQDVPGLKNPLGLAATGAAANVLQGSIVAMWNNKPYLKDQALADAKTGAIAGAIAGPVSSGIAKYLPTSMVSKTTNQVFNSLNQDAAIKSGIVSGIRSFIAGIFSNDKQVQKGN